MSATRQETQTRKQLKSLEHETNALQVEERKHLPTLREFLDPVVEDMDPENCIEDEYKVRSENPMHTPPVF